MRTAYEVAQFFLHHAYDGERDQISHLKLQKLLYYAQGYSLAISNKLMFNEPIECWPHGPVVKSIYHCYKKHGGKPIPAVTHFNTKAFSDEDIEVLKFVAKEYGQYSAWKLRDMTHCEDPWKTSFSKKLVIISTDSIQQYFSSKVKSDNFNFSLSRMQNMLNTEFVPMPDNIKSLEEFDEWLSEG